MSPAVEVAPELLRVAALEAIDAARVPRAGAAVLGLLVSGR